ncbi:phosphonate C-P lyase system protein PhnH [Roseomonas hellenica]|uniref:Phosphonate C-P lyase system protein PhnH n=1 Tax=Plastoroseomonas hellenica TaxID=2687306 RepID=A0ABS5F089_9PROT|nr:phosphonate C-P lyase system protein PhnH [Plastoroseomonas hellenica]MBR0665595.1 phosphonate C-P lyase system protein PhnH [Plastoroseomonas hellenica]
MNDLLPGFADPVLDAQSAFRAVLEAMSRPGRIVAIDRLPEAPVPLMPAAAAVLLTLADADTPVWSDAGDRVVAWLGFHAGCPIASTPLAARFVLATGAAPALDALDPGSEEEPQFAATLILQVQALERPMDGGPEARRSESAAYADKLGSGWRLTGPGIEHAHHLHVIGAPTDFLAQWRAQRPLFPCGVDVILCAGTRLAALPRTVQIEEG